jgi:hypothetical protein
LTLSLAAQARDLSLPATRPEAAGVPNLEEYSRQLTYQALVDPSK